MGHEVAWEYFEHDDPYMAFVKEVCTGDEFFKYRHLNEDALANAILRLNSGDFPTLICGHSHEPRDRSRFHNAKGKMPPGGNDKNVFTRYMNSGSAGRFDTMLGVYTGTAVSALGEVGCRVGGEGVLHATDSIGSRTYHGRGVVTRCEYLTL